MTKLKHYLLKNMALFFIAIMGIAILTFNIGIKRGFNTYVVETKEKNINLVLKTLSYMLSQDMDSVYVYRGINMYLASTGMQVQVFDEEGTSVFDSTDMQYSRMGRNMFRNPGMKRIAKVLPDGRNVILSDQELTNQGWTDQELIHTHYDIDVNNKTYKVVVGVPSQDLGQLESKYMVTINTILAGVLVLGILMILITSKFIASKISKPIERLNYDTGHISKNDYEQVKVIDSGITEIAQLSKGMHNLARSLERHQRYQKDMTVNIAHELRSPLAVLQSHIEALIDGVWEPTPQRLKVFQNEILRLTTLVEDLHDLTIIERDGFDLERREVDLISILKDIKMTFTPIYQGKNLDLSMDLDEKEIKILGDDRRLKQIFVNILMNSYKYTDQGGVHISLFEGAKDIMIKVEDSGIGMNAITLENIFERFYRADESRTRDTGGAGVGLSIVKALVDAHEGHVEVHSEVGKGTTFVLRFNKINSVD